MEKLSNPQVTIETIKKYEFAFQKKFGQNFLIDSHVINKIISAADITKDDCVLEIGPGIGPLTEQLAQLGAQVAAVELDRSLLPILAETMAGRENVEIIPGDILKLDLPALCREKFPGLPVVACANLPYNITTPVITALLESGCFGQVTVMIQREVARRICAKPGTAEYGAFTLLCEYYADREILYDVPPSCFLPAPKVVSSVIRMTLRGRPPVPVGDPALFFRVVRGAFGQRRKTLLNVLYTLFAKQVDKETLAQQLVACNLTEDIRGERLSFAEFAQLTEKLTNLACIKNCKGI